MVDAGGGLPPRRQGGVAPTAWRFDLPLTPIASSSQPLATVTLLCRGEFLDYLGVYYRRLKRALQPDASEPKICTAFLFAVWANHHRPSPPVLSL